jgi:hypothetical protein
MRHSIINFSVFNPVEMCHFIMERVHPEVIRLLETINKCIIEGELEIIGMDKESLLPIHFLQIQEKSHTLIRLEKMVLYPHILNQYMDDDKVEVNIGSYEHLQKLQQQLFALITQLRLTINYYLPSHTLSYKENMLFNDLYHLELKISDWVHLVQFQLMPKLNICLDNSSV